MENENKVTHPTDSVLPNVIKRKEGEVQLSDEEKLQIIVEIYEKPLPMVSTAAEPKTGKLTIHKKRVADNSLISGWGTQFYGAIDPSLPVFSDQDMEDLIEQVKRNPAQFKWKE